MVVVLVGALGCRLDAVVIKWTCALIVKIGIPDPDRVLARPKRELQLENKIKMRQMNFGRLDLTKYPDARVLSIPS